MSPASARICYNAYFCFAANSKAVGKMMNNICERESKTPKSRRITPMLAFFTPLLLFSMNSGCGDTNTVGVEVGRKAAKIGSAKGCARGDTGSKKYRLVPRPALA